MRIAFALLVPLVLGACAHTDVAINSTGSPGSGTHVVSGSAGFQVNASGGLAAALAVGVIIAATAGEADDFAATPAPQMDPRRKVSEQDCTRPITGSGNLKCR